MTFPLVQLQWERTHRLILSQYPPISLFEDIADPRDWELLAEAEAVTNPRIYEEIGNLALVPVERRVGGPGASCVMASFTHVTTDRPSRFSDGTYGAYYAAESVETAIHEHAFHMARHYARTPEEPGWISQVRELVGAIDRQLTDIRTGDNFALLNPDSYVEPQSFARAERESGRNGIVYPSVRRAGGECFAAFWPDVVKIPVQGDHYAYHWNGETIDYVKRQSGEEAVFELRF
ncbi:RES family NAD+ phosphorylase [Erythrobacter donghaensis]|uniref:RES family NAD+ phosphorylase n=1 Tax=Erythrobacter donghaensis TaxID=267135 RepID=UPI000A360B57|nr:RES family NAD+ phosphorylase [Erythrobacter donghaensis]